MGWRTPDTVARFKTKKLAWFRQHRLLNTMIFSERPLPLKIQPGRIRLLFALCSNPAMNDSPASWRMPTPTQLKKLAVQLARKAASPAPTPDAALPAEYWDSVLKDPRAGTNGHRLSQRRLSEIQRHVLRVSCRRCDRTVEIQTVDAVRLYGGNAIWKDVAQRLLDNTCQQRTGRLEEDGCWPAFDVT
jgi:hypothetical protein